MPAVPVKFLIDLQMMEFASISDLTIECLNKRGM